MSEIKKLKLGDLAVFVIPNIEGIVSGKRFNQESDEFEYALSYIDSNSESHTRWFKEGELQAPEQNEEGK